MSVPEANPAAAQPRAIVDTTAGRVSFWFDLKADHWEFFDEEAAILGDATYPESFGYRPLRILIRAQPGVSSSAVEAALTQSGATNVSNDGYSWYSATTDLFAEKEVAFRILKNHNDILKYAQINSVVEWIADRQMAFSFSGNLEK